MRTDKEILAKIEEVKIDDFLGTKRNDLLGYLSYRSVTPFLKEGITEKEWEAYPKDAGSIKKEMTDYMDFAWEKANECRGISAARTMDHYYIWLWMLGDHTAELFGDVRNYSFYGKDHLVKICNFLGLSSENWDDGVRTN